MDHVAIMKASWQAGDTIYFKKSGHSVTVRATASKVDQFDNLTPSAVQDLLDRHAKTIGVDAEEFFPLWITINDINRIKL